MSKILIVEDEISIAELERDYLEISGFEVELCHDGEEGLALALEKDYDLILLDVMLPGVDGFDICKRVREHKDTRLSWSVPKKKTLIRFGAWGWELMIISPSRFLPANWWPGSRPIWPGMSVFLAALR